MKRYAIIFLNILIALGMILFVFLYMGNENRKLFDNDCDHLKSMTVSMEKVTENYLEGEQHICDVWAHHMISSRMTIQEAMEFVKDSHVSAIVSAHLLYIDDGSLEGLSTREGTDGKGSAVSYAGLDILDNLDDMYGLGEGINLTKAYSNPKNGVRSIAFFN
ncbi:MAG: hypothetical protein IJ863_07240, partial [Spirochaetales bacterium]|nr:hypothetical protein [Spirochaetales bacterium]